jgi:hypothetical protein
VSYEDERGEHGQFESVAHDRRRRADPFSCCWTDEDGKHACNEDAFFVCRADHGEGWCGVALCEKHVAQPERARA